MSPLTHAYLDVLWHLLLELIQLLLGLVDHTLCLVLSVHSLALLLVLTREALSVSHHALHIILAQCGRACVRRGTFRGRGTPRFSARQATLHYQEN